MISLPVYSRARGMADLITRRKILVTVIEGLVFHTSLKSLGRLPNAISLFLKVSCTCGEEDIPGFLPKRRFKNDIIKNKMIQLHNEVSRAKDNSLHFLYPGNRTNYDIMQVSFKTN